MRDGKLSELSVRRFVYFTLRCCHANINNVPGSVKAILE